MHDFYFLLTNYLQKILYIFTLRFIEWICFVEVCQQKKVESVGVLTTMSYI